MPGSPHQAGVHILPTDDATELAFFEALAEMSSESSDGCGEEKEADVAHWNTIGKPIGKP